MIDMLHPDSLCLDRIIWAVALLRRGKLVVFPTETVYGLGANAFDEQACRAIFASKKRPHSNPLIVHVADLAAAERIVVFSRAARKLAEACWPGPLTIVLPRHPDCELAPSVTAGLSTVAIRIPAHPVAADLLERCGFPVAAPSANRSGRLSPTCASHAAGPSGVKAALILDGGECTYGLESTVVAFVQDQPAIVRLGSLAPESIHALLPSVTISPAAQLDSSNAGTAYQADLVPAPIAPGMAFRHYAPMVPLRINARTPDAGEVLLGFGGTEGAALDLSPSGDLAEAAHHLFDYLHRLSKLQLEQQNPAGIAVVPIPARGLGLAINDRLARASGCVKLAKP
ncbi:MAG: L-threonylcarbamoyladenylate synthase [Pseudomonadota bacterium]